MMSQIFSTGLGRRRWPAALPLALALTMAGCASEQAFRDAERLAASGQAVASLERYQYAAQVDPSNVAYRSAYLRAKDKVLASLLVEAAQAEARGEFEAARQRYQRVLGFEPQHVRARGALQRLAGKPQPGAAPAVSDAGRGPDAGMPAGAPAQLPAAAPESAPPAVPPAAPSAAARPLQSPKEAALADRFRRPMNLELRDATLKQAFDAISISAGLNFVFDKDIKLDTRATLLLKDSTVEAALYYLMLTNQLEHQPMDANTVLVYPNSAAKLKDYQQTVVRSFQLRNATAKAVAETLKTLLKTRDIVIDEKLNLLILRDSAATMRLAEKLVAAQDMPQPEVMLEVTVLEVTRDRLRDLGVQLPGTLTLSPLPAQPVGTTTITRPITLADLRNQGSSQVAVAFDPLRVNALDVDSDTNILANPRIRVVNNEKAKIMIGSRVPSVTTSTVATGTGIVSDVVNYLDVGLKLDVEPTIYANDEVAIRVALEVSNIVDRKETARGTVTYTIGSRSAQTILRLKDGENQVLAGLINDEDRQSANKLPGLGSIPVLGRLFGSGRSDRRKSEILLSITPRVVRSGDHAESVEFASGTDNNPRLPPERRQEPAVPQAPASRAK